MTAENKTVQLTVWYGKMPESNGNTNWTVILKRAGDDSFSAMAEGFTIHRSEYPDRARYEADSMRYLIGEIDTEPCILDYDGDLKTPNSLPPGTPRPLGNSPVNQWLVMGDRPDGSSYTVHRYSIAKMLADEGLDVRPLCIKNN